VTPLDIYLRRMGQSEAAGPEFSMLAWQMASARDKSLFATPEFLRFAKEHKAVFA
jgi:hypothetical protein